jgi:hypothetical protein
MRAVFCVLVSAVSLSGVASADYGPGCPISAGAFSRRYYVSTSTGSSLANGSYFPENASSDLAAVLASAPPNSTILLCQGDRFVAPSGGFVVTKPNVSISSYACRSPDTSAGGTSAARPVITMEVRLPPPVETYGIADGLQVWKYDIRGAGLQVPYIWAVWNGESRQRYIPARYPNVAQPGNYVGVNKTEFIFISGYNTTYLQVANWANVKGMNSDTYWVNATVRHRDSDWSYLRNVVGAVNPQNGSLLFTRGISAFYGNPGFYLEHGLSELDAPGEYVYDAAAGILHVIPIGDPASSKTSQPDQTWILPGRLPWVPWQAMNDVAAISCLFSVTGSGFSLSNVDLVGGFRAVCLNGDRAAVSNLTVNRMVSQAILATGSDNLVADSYISDVDVAGAMADKATGFLSVHRVRMERIGLLAGYASMPRAVSGFINVHNSTFTDLGYAGIMANANSTVVGNDIRNILLTLCDGAAIYGWGLSTVGVVVRNNRISGIRPNPVSSHGRYMIGYGVYTDDCSSSWTVEGNVVEVANFPQSPDSRTPSDRLGAVNVHNSFNNLFANNTFLGGALNINHDRLGIDYQKQYCEPQNTTITNNTFVQTSNSAYDEVAFIGVNYAGNLPYKADANVTLRLDQFLGNIFLYQSRLTLIVKGFPNLSLANQTVSPL